jgi:3-deoxy-7-phosphoheptulonate synthase
MVDPSHAAGRRDLIFDMSCAAIAIGASGLVIEAHYNPAEAMVDAQQMITPSELRELIETCKNIHKIVTPARRKVRVS